MKRIASSPFFKGFVIGVILALIALAVMSLTGCSSCSRMGKSFSSDISGGLDRTVTAYDYNGKKLGEWSGKFDISEDDNEIFFDDANGKRVIIQNAIVIAEEN